MCLFCKSFSINVVLALTLIRKQSLLNAVFQTFEWRVNTILKGELWLFPLMEKVPLLLHLVRGFDEENLYDCYF